jgi:two-component system, NtrC family, sensor kinase
MRWSFICMMVILFSTTHGQSIDYSAADTNYIMKLLETANVYNFSKPDSGLLLSEKALDMSRKLHYKNGEALALHTNGEAYQLLGDFPQSLKFEFAALELSRELNDKTAEAGSLSYIGLVYIQLGEYREALQYLMPGSKISQEASDISGGAFILSNMGDVYDFLKMPDSALYYQKKAYNLFPGIRRPHLRSFLLRHMGIIYAEVGERDSAIKYYHAAILNSVLFHDKINMSMTQRRLSVLYDAVPRYDSSLHYAYEAFLNARTANAKLEIYEASTLLASLYRKGKNTDSAFFYMDIAATTKDSLYGPEKVRQLQLLMLRQQQDEQLVRQREEQLRNKIKYISILVVLGLSLLLAFMLIRNNRNKQKANNLLKVQKARVERSLEELKSTQAQLIQREKMASLGELTAGVAHEIQNPLNFINNFSELNTELIAEMKQEMDNGSLQDAKTIANSIDENEQKINQHGKRADAIVKGMLQHARSSSGVKEPTDINALADEYLRLAYHGFRAKDNSFNALMQNDFDESIGKINIIPQDIGRVLLNLYNNAFYAVSEKKKQQSESYEPTVSVSTKRTDNRVTICVKDNGNGLSQKVLDKIFQPFFTTKPTGQGTGLGLSMSYDIIKSHGGELKVESKEGEGAEFIVLIPVG